MFVAEITEGMIQGMTAAAERALCEQVEKFNIRSIDEMHHDTVRLMIEAALAYQKSSAELQAIAAISKPLDK